MNTSDLAVGKLSYPPFIALRFISDELPPAQSLAPLRCAYSVPPRASERQGAAAAVSPSGARGRSSSQRRRGPVLRREIGKASRRNTRQSDDDPDRAFPLVIERAVEICARKRRNGQHDRNAEGSRSNPCYCGRSIREGHARARVAADTPGICRARSTNLPECGSGSGRGEPHPAP